MVRADWAEVEELRAELPAAERAGLRAGVSQAEADLRAEAAPISQRLAEGVSSEIDLAAQPMEGRVIVTAIRPAQPARQAVVVSARSTKVITLRPQRAFDYAETIATGRDAIRPKEGGALLIPVDQSSIRSGESYIRAGEYVFIVRPYAGAVAPNPFDERAATRTEQVVEDVVGDAVDASL
jgi:hypothetical protein